MSLTTLWGLSLGLSILSFFLEKPAASVVFGVGFVVFLIADIIGDSIKKANDERELAALSEKVSGQHEQLVMDTVCDLLDDPRMHHLFFDRYNQRLQTVSHSVNYKDYFDSIKQLADERGADVAVIIEVHARDARDAFKNAVLNEIYGAHSQDNSLQSSNPVPAP